MIVVAEMHDLNNRALTNHLRKIRPIRVFEVFIEIRSPALQDCVSPYVN